MDIELDQENRQLKIDDNIKFQYWMLRFVMICNIVSASLKVFSASIPEWDMLTWFWIPIGIFSLFMLFYFLSLSTAEVIPFENIEYPILKNFFGRKRLSLKLKNGKTRHLPIKSPKEIQEIQDLLKSPQQV